MEDPGHGRNGWVATGKNYPNRIVIPLEYALPSRLTNVNICGTLFGSSPGFCFLPLYALYRVTVPGIKWFQSLTLDEHVYIIYINTFQRRDIVLYDMVGILCVHHEINNSKIRC